jgi:ABC-2 type transport system ATP-binding protein
VCDHLILLSQGKAVLTGDIDDLVTGHRILVGSSAAEPPVAAGAVIHRSSTERQASLLVRGDADEVPGWHVEPPSLDALIRGYLRAARGR